MKVVQNVLIEETEDRNPEQEQDDGGKETNIWLGHFVALRILLTRS
jgi:hypothetical protein